MAKIRVEINQKGLRKLFRSEEMKGACKRAAEAVAERAGGEGYNVSSYKGPHKAGAAVWCNSREAMEDNLENNTLLKALGTVIPDEKIVQK